MANDTITATVGVVNGGLARFIEQSPTPFHASASIRALLEEAGFTRLCAEERWETKAGRRYVVTLGGGAVFGIIRGERRICESGVVVLAAHTDSPALKIKERAAKWSKGYLTLPTELYGSPIRSTWLDRPLGIAGRAVLHDGQNSGPPPDSHGERFVLPERAVVPNLALHLNPKTNDGVSYNAQDDLVAVFDSNGDKKDGDAREDLLEMVSSALGGGAVDEIDLYLFDPSPLQVIGVESRLLSGPRIDNLSGCFANVNAFLRAKPARTAILALFNHEETGSKSGEGAESDFLSAIVRRLVAAEGGDAEDAMVAAARSLIVSNDVAHGLHPAHSAKYDQDYAPVLNGGPVVKVHGMYRYATTPATAAQFGRACKEAGVELQRVTNRSDVRSGSTVGPISWARTGMPTVDVGIPILSMHSIRETAGALDTELMIRALTAVLEDAT